MYILPNQLFRKTMEVFENDIMRTMEKVCKRKLVFTNVMRSRLHMKAIFEDEMEGERNRGGPQRRWKEDIHKGLDKNVERKELNMKLKDRVDWKTLQLIRDMIHTNGEHKSFDQ